MKYLFLLLILYSCSTEKCEEEIGYQYPYKVEILDTAGNYLETRFAYSYHQEYRDSVITFTSDYCKRGRRTREQFYCKPDECIIHIL